jgi:hypothetical protein
MPIGNFLRGLFMLIPGVRIDDGLLYHQTPAMTHPGHARCSMRIADGVLTAAFMITFMRISVGGLLILLADMKNQRILYYLPTLTTSDAAQSAMSQPGLIITWRSNETTDVCLVGNIAGASAARGRGGQYRRAVCQWR